jgi:ubiquinone/menaquinone biosynthesis C-methylase UbiE
MHPPPCLDYDTLAGAYRENRQVHPGVITSFLNRIDLQHELDLLEVGCGTGNYIGQLSTLDALNCTGIDPSSEMLAHARARFVSVHFEQARAESLPFANAHFDFVFTVDVIHHVQDRAAYLREAFRVLRSGARICTVTDSESVIRRRRPLSSHFPETIDVELARYPTVEQLRAGLTQAGYVNLSEEEVVFEYELTDIRAYISKAYSALHLIDLHAFERGVARLVQELQQGPVACQSLYTLLWAEKP